jgi:DNA-binding LytR/AlgR family response regulator
MNIVLIEDEQPARERIWGLIKEIEPSATITASLETVKEAIKWFNSHPSPDLVILDVQLADGTAFDLLKLTDINCPVIFTTAYSNFAVESYKTTSIDYLLKPVKKTELQQAMMKLSRFKELFTETGTASIAPMPAKPADYKKRFIIRFGEHIKTLDVDQISYCASENKNTFARSFDGQKHPMDYNLDALEQMLNPQNFFRINRQYLINLKSIDEMKIYTKSRVLVKLNPPVKEPPIVSSERAADFKLWLAGELPA